MRNVSSDAPLSEKLWSELFSSPVVGSSSSPPHHHRHQRWSEVRVIKAADGLTLHPSCLYLLEQTLWDRSESSAHRKCFGQDSSTRSLLIGDSWFWFQLLTCDGTGRVWVGGGGQLVIQRLKKAPHEPTVSQLFRIIPRAQRFHWNGVLPERRSLCKRFPVRSVDSPSEELGRRSVKKRLF